MISIRITRPSDIGAVLRAWRDDHRMSQVDLAKKLGVSQRWVSHVENGKPTLQLGLVLRVLNELGIDLFAGATRGAGAEAKSAVLAQSAPSKRLTDIDSIVDD
ncbi:helix-turn-helix domain-containing protein [Vitreimonas flagellata]|uniref:helix-turn-helix domain-containing protein n=1 Tax=Vitreimonas flagellata TaxID=2560861 RepID=UPI0010754CBE|nr:helix-turn-helix domain-containing protein [Vitreimonas flagellata]